MKKPQFDEHGCDATTFAPFELEDCLNTEWKDVRLAFCDWQWFQDNYNSDTVDNYYMNGYGVEGLVKACRFSAGLEVEPDSIHYNSEGDTCYIHFTDLSDAVATANLSSTMINSIDNLTKGIQVAREHGFEDS